MNIENLKIWRDFLLNNDVPFAMRHLHQVPGTDDLVYLTKDLVDAGVKGCGTAGCAVGWAPFVFPATPTEFNIDLGGVRALNIVAYMARVFGIDAMNSEFDYIAASAWASLDDSRLGAAYRINCVINGEFEGDDPYDFHPREIDFDEYVAARDAWLASL